MLKKHKSLLSIFSIAIIIGAFGVSGIISASNKTSDNNFDTAKDDVAIAAKPLIITDQDDSRNSLDGSSVTGSSTNYMPTNTSSNLSLGSLSMDDDDDDMEDEDEDEFESSRHDSKKDYKLKNLHLEYDD